MQSASDTIQSNRVAYNGDNGIRIPNVSDVPGNPGVRIQIVDNLIYANTSLGIDLGLAGVTANDPLDADDGANLLQNFPELTSFVGNLSVSRMVDKLGRQPNSTATTLSVSGTLRSTPSSTFVVNWFFSTASQCVANQQTSQPLQFGKVPNVSTDSNGIGPFTIPFEFPVGTTTGVINCTATDSLGNTSEFSACLPVTAPTPAPTPALQLLLEEAGAANHAAALDSLLLIRDPFPVINDKNPFDPVSDQNTRVLVFVRNLPLAPNDTAAAVMVHLVDSNNQNYDIAAENVWSDPNVDFSQISFRLPNSLPSGACTIQITVHGQISNTGFIQIKL